MFGTLWCYSFFYTDGRLFAAFSLASQAQFTIAIGMAILGSSSHFVRSVRAHGINEMLSIKLPSLIRYCPSLTTTLADNEAANHKNYYKYGYLSRII